MSEAVTGGSFMLGVTFDGLDVFNSTGTVCGTTKISLPLGMGTLTYTGLACPTSAGSSGAVTLSTLIPSSAPGGSFDILLASTDQNGNPLFCANLAWTGGR
jgi:hypothetical protein